MSQTCEALSKKVHQPGQIDELHTAVVEVESIVNSISLPSDLKELLPILSLQNMLSVYLGYQAGSSLS